MGAAITTPWTFPERLGVFCTIVAAVFSLAATVSVLAYAGFRSAKRRLNGWRGKGRLARPSDAVDSALFINLMLMDMLEAVGVFPNIRWMADGMVTSGPLCTSQAVMKNFSGVGIATAALAIAVHGFSIIVLDWKPRRHATTMIIAAVWILTAFIVIIPTTLVRHGLYGDVGFWCWITPTHQKFQVANHYFWLLLDGFLMVIFYSIMFMVVKGWLMVDDGRFHWYKSYKPSGNSKEEESDEDKELKAIAKMMLFYPAVYVVVVCIYSAARLRYFFGHHTPYQFTIFANCVYTLSGVFDVALFLTTRPQLIGRDPTTHNQTASIQMTPTIYAVKSEKNGHLPIRHINLGLVPGGAEQYLHNKLGGRKPEALLTPSQDRVFQVEYGRSPDWRRAGSTSGPLQESSLYEDLGHIPA